MALQVGRIRDMFMLKHRSTQDVLVGVSALFLVLARVLALAGAVVGIVARRRRAPQ